MSASCGANGRPHGDVVIERHLLLRKATEYKPATEDVIPYSPPLRSMENNATASLSGTESNCLREDAAPLCR